MFTISVLEIIKTDGKQLKQRSSQKYQTTGTKLQNSSNKLYPLLVLNLQSINSKQLKFTKTQT